MFSPSWRSAIALYAVLGFGILAKGPVGLILPTAVIGMFLLIVNLPERNKAPGPANRSWNRARVRLTGALRCFAPAHFFRTCMQMRLLTATLVALAVAGLGSIWWGSEPRVRFGGDFLSMNTSAARQMPWKGIQADHFINVIAILVGFFPGRFLPHRCLSVRFAAPRAAILGGWDISSPYVGLGST